MKPPELSHWPLIEEAAFWGKLSRFAITKGDAPRASEHAESSAHCALLHMESVSGTMPPEWRVLRGMRWTGKYWVMARRLDGTERVENEL
jgi:hypothetical protein